ncbi:MAG: hypothetical protein IT349_19765 [Candidatus Eisenbacteria bacterium]|nr:hypothetical protein [Candidatus Eisenbacteria bacterium]
MRKLLLAIVVLVLTLGGAGDALAVANCEQVSYTWCEPYTGCTRTINWRGSCENGDREWRCSWGGSPTCENYLGAWQDCCCIGEQCHSAGCDCLLPGSLIAMADGSKKAVEKIVVGDMVLSFNPLTRELSPSPVTKIHQPYLVDHYFVVDGSLHASENHPVWSGNDWVAVRDLAVGSAVYAVAGAARVGRVERVDQATLVYNFQVENSTYIADGFIVHNKEDCELYTQYCPPCED